MHIYTELTGTHIYPYPSIIRSSNSLWTLLSCNTDNIIKYLSNRAPIATVGWGGSVWYYMEVWWHQFCSKSLCFSAYSKQGWHFWTKWLFFFILSMLRMQHPQVRQAEVLPPLAILGDTQGNTEMYHENGPSNTKQTSQCRPETWFFF